MSETTAVRYAGTEHTRALRILAKSVYRELVTSGYGRTEVVQFTNELLELVTSEMRGEPEVEDSAC